MDSLLGVRGLSPKGEVHIEHRSPGVSGHWEMAGRAVVLRIEPPAASRP